MTDAKVETDKTTVDEQVDNQDVVAKNKDLEREVNELREKLKAKEKRAEGGLIEDPKAKESGEAIVNDTVDLEKKFEEFVSKKEQERYEATLSEEEKIVFKGCLAQGSSTEEAKTKVSGFFNKTPVHTNTNNTITKEAQEDMETAYQEAKKKAESKRRSYS